MKRRTILSSILVIIACIAVISGTTFALFTSESSVNIAITSGKVNVVATLDNLECYSATADTSELTDAEKADVAGTITSGPFAGTYYYDKLDGTTFTNNGKAIIDTNQLLTLKSVTPGDKVKVNVNIANNSNVKIQYRIRVNVVEGENAVKSLKLFSGLKTKIAGTEFSDVIKVTAWTVLEAEADIDVMPVEIYLPLEAGNEYQDLSTQIKITVEAVQSNAHTASLDGINKVLEDLNTKHNTMYDAIKAVIDDSETNYVEADFYPYVWNVDTDRFYDESSVDGNFFYKYFKAYDAMPNVQTYSIYAIPNQNWTAPVSGLTVGFDAGNATGITSVTYDRSDATYGREVIIRTNSSATTLTINAPKDVVKHYGEVGVLSIVAIAGQSYHEFGRVGFLDISTGHIALEETAQVSTIHLNATEEVTDNGTDKVFKEIKISYDSSLSDNLPSFSRDDVEIPKEGKLVVELTKVDNTQEEEKSDFVWLTKQGIFEQIKVSGSAESTEDAKWADDSHVENNTKTAAQQIANNIGRDNSGNINVAVTVTNDTVEKTYKVELNATRDLVVVDEADTTKTAVATVNSEGEITVNNQKYTVELSKNTENTTELVITNQGDSTDVVKANAVVESGLNATKKETSKENIISSVARIDNIYYVSLQDAIDNAKLDDIVVLLKDVVGDRISIIKSITLDGDNHKLIDDKSDGSAIWIDDTDVEFTIKNITIDGANKCQRGLQVNPLDDKWNNATIIMDNCIIENMTYYAINFCSNTTVNITINNSTIEGWAALNAYGTGNVVVASNSTFIGTNDKGYNSEGWNDFATICLEGDTTNETTLHSEDYDVTFNNCVFVVSQTTGNKQTILGFNKHSENNTIKFNNCEFDIGNGCYFGYNFGSKTYPNVLKIDNETISMPDQYFNIKTYNNKKIAVVVGAENLVDKVVALGYNVVSTGIINNGYYVNYVSNNIIYRYFSDDNVRVYDTSEYTDSSYVVPQNVTELGQDSFRGNNTIKKLTFTNQVNSAYKALDGNSTISEIDFGSMTSIPNRMFYGCTGVKIIVIPATVKRIEDFAFYGNTVIEYVFAKDLDYVGYKAFDACSSLRVLDLGGDDIQIMGWAGRQVKSIETIIIRGENASVNLDYAPSGQSKGAFVFDKTQQSGNPNTMPDVDLYVANDIVANAFAYEIQIEGATRRSIVSVSTQAELNEALKNGSLAVFANDIICTEAHKAPYGNDCFVKQENGGIIDGNGYALSAKFGGDTYAIITYGGMIMNVTIYKAFRGVVTYTPTRDVILYNVVSGAEEGVCYTLNTAEQKPVKIIALNSSFNGWTSFAGMESVEFINCCFGQGNYYPDVNGRLVRPYVNTTFENCTFIKGFYVDLSALGNTQTIKFVNCTANDKVISSGNITNVSNVEHEGNEANETDTVFYKLPSGRDLSTCVEFN